MTTLVDILVRFWIDGLPSASSPFKTITPVARRCVGSARNRLHRSVVTKCSRSEMPTIHFCKISIHSCKMSDRIRPKSRKAFCLPRHRAPQPTAVPTTAADRSTPPAGRPGFCPSAHDWVAVRIFLGRAPHFGLTPPPPLLTERSYRMVAPTKKFSPDSGNVLVTFSRK